MLISITKNGAETIFLPQLERVAPHGTRAERENLQPSLRGCDGERV